MVKNQDEEITELDRLNAQLASSLKRCRRILLDCQSRLASHNNTPDKAGDQGDLSVG
jgi:hypothetical protein